MFMGFICTEIENFFLKNSKIKTKKKLQNLKSTKDQFYGKFVVSIKKKFEHIYGCMYK